MRIALLEDDPAQVEIMSAWLAASGHDMHTFGLARDFLRQIHRESYDLLLIDWMLPDQNGHEVLLQLRGERQMATPVIFVTSRDAEDDIVTALRDGADDYMVKPIRRMELLSRIEAVRRRYGLHEDLSETILIPPFRFDLTARQVTRNDIPIEKLTEKEFQLALFMFRNLGRLLSRGHLLEAIWGLHASIPTRTLDTHVSRVRSKLALQPANGFRLTPVYNFGYRLERLEQGE